MDKSIKKGYLQETPVQDQFLYGRVIFFVINYFLEQHDERIPVTSRKPQFTQKHLSPCQIHDHI